MWVGDKEIIITGKWIKTANLAPECYADIEQPDAVIDSFKRTGEKADIFTFAQRLPETVPKYNYYMERESVAAMRIASFDYWWQKQIPKHVRKKVKKAEKEGVLVKLAEFDDEFVKGIVEIYNEEPIRQGKPFWHYRKDFESVKRINSTYLPRSNFIGAYYHGELIGFIKIFFSEGCASTMQVISKIKHRDKAPTNALIAEMVKLCAEKKIPNLTYGVWSKGTLGDFKRYNGFERVELPRYYVPLNWKGKIALKLHLHHGLSPILPEKIILRLKELRAKWYSMKKRNRNLAHGAIS
jgi:hypothetical protein